MGRGAGDVVMLDDCNFHESVSLDRFETERTLELVPPDGEFALMNYRSTYASSRPSACTPPWRMTGMRPTRFRACMHQLGQGSNPHLHVGSSELRSGST